MHAERLQIIQQRMAAACERAHRSPDSVTLVAVSKTHPPQTVEVFAGLGVINFGENKVQEAKAKIPLCSGRLRWHGIGHLQTNKVREAVALFHILHAVDSARVAEEIEKHAGEQSKRMPVLIEVNVSGEGTKYGAKPEELTALARLINGLPHVELRGLMAMAPFSDDPQESRPHFRRLNHLRQQLEQSMGAPLPDLSMGMSGDFEVAIEEGATLVRIGTALMGERRASAFRTLPLAES